MTDNCSKGEPPNVANCAQRSHGNLENINDHKAFICGCGSVHFNLLKSLGIECSGCGKQFGRWREVGIDSGLLFAAMREIVNRIETCGASPELTAVVSLASDLSSAIGNKFNEPDGYALERVKSELST